MSGHRIQVREVYPRMWEYQILDDTGTVVSSDGSPLGGYVSEADARAAADAELRRLTHDRSWRD